MYTCISRAWRTGGDPQGSSANAGLQPQLVARSTAAIKIKIVALVLEGLKRGNIIKVS